ncbi:MAG: Maf family protein [Rhodococcus sp. (in: high G+C Gram-positive bacteria)]
MSVRLVLASRSPARLSVLRAAGIDPVVRVSDVDEDAVAAALPASSSHETIVTELATAKTTTISQALSSDPELSVGTVVVVGCDSMLSLGDELMGKPHDIDVARSRWATMAGTSGRLLTGHCVQRVDDGVVAAQSAAHCATIVHFSTPDPGDLEAYLRSGEPLGVAGAFTLDGLGGWFVDGIEGDPSSVIGIGLPLVRRLLADVGVTVAQLWAGSGPTGR